MREIDAAQLPAGLRASNRKAFDAYAARDPDVRLSAQRSPVFYDAGYRFMAALPKMPYKAEGSGARRYVIQPWLMLRRLYAETPIRFWSRGV